MNRASTALTYVDALCNSDRVEANKSTAKFSSRGQSAALSLVLFKRHRSARNSTPPLFSFSLSVSLSLSLSLADRYIFFSPTITILFNTSVVVHRLNPRWERIKIDGFITSSFPRAIVKVRNDVRERPWRQLYGTHVASVARNFIRRSKKSALSSRSSRERRRHNSRS